MKNTWRNLYLIAHFRVNPFWQFMRLLNQQALFEARMFVGCKESVFHTCKHSVKAASTGYLLVSQCLEGGQLYKQVLIT